MRAVCQPGRTGTHRRGRPIVAPADQKKPLAPWGQFLRSPQFWCIGGQLGTANFVSSTFSSHGFPSTCLRRIISHSKRWDLPRRFRNWRLPSEGHLCGLATDYSSGASSRPRRRAHGLAASASSCCCFGSVSHGHCRDGKSPPSSGCRWRWPSSGSHEFQLDERLGSGRRISRARFPPG